jgi:hypothetical protein
LVLVISAKSDTVMCRRAEEVGLYSLRAMIFSGPAYWPSKRAMVSPALRVTKAFFQLGRWPT